MSGGECDAGINGGFQVGRRFGENKLPGEGDEAGLLSAGAGEKSAHLNG